MSDFSLRQSISVNISHPRGSLNAIKKQMNEQGEAE
jgi:hypothetical protein